MAVMKWNFIIFVLYILKTLHVENSKLNVPRVLLPLFNDISSNFTLEVNEGGCYRWSTSRLDIIQLYPQDIDETNDCSRRVIISAISKEATRNTAIVLAEEVQSGQMIRCDVIVDKIHILNIVTTTHELFMEEAPEAFEVRAYDDQGNEFTSLEGVEFLWTLTSASKSTDSTVLRFISFKDSSYETPASIKDFDERGLRGHITLLEGVKTGTTKVTVRLPHPEYQSVPPVEVQLMVVANVIVEPPEAYILRGGTIKLKIYHVEHNRLHEIILPHSQYYLEVESHEIASVDSISGIITGLNMGKTKINLHDRNVGITDSSVKIPSATLHVISPSYLTINILPHRNWAIMVEDSHDIAVEVYEEHNHKIYLGDEVEVRTNIDEEYFSIDKRSRNGTYLTGRGLKSGITVVSAALEGVISHQFGFQRILPPITAEADLHIFPKITLTPEEIILPWDIQVQPKYEIKIQASGGDGNFVWSTSNSAIGIVTQSGLLKTQGLGYVEISAAMKRNRFNKKTCKIHILPPSRLEIIEFVLEAEINSPIFLQIAMYAERDRSRVPIPFTKCQDVSFIVKTSDNNFFYNKSAIAAPVGAACTTIAIIGQTAGTAKVTVSYKVENVLLEDSVFVSAFNPLKAIHPASGESVLAVGTSRNLIFSGGPKPLFNHHSKHKNRILSSDNNTVEVKDGLKLPENGFYSFNVLCRHLGESIVTLIVVNRPLISHCKQVESSASIRVICGKPRSIYLRPNMDPIQFASCPIDFNSDRIVVHDYENVDLEVIVKDEVGKIFDNITSLNTDWKLAPSKFGKVLCKNCVFPKTFIESTVILPNGTFQIVNPQNEKGIVEVFVTITGYRDLILQENSIMSEWPEFVGEDEKGVDKPIIMTSISLVLSEDAIVTPKSAVIYNQPGNKFYFDVLRGSAYYEIGLSSPDLAEVTYSEVTRRLEVIPLKDGDLTISLIDLCLRTEPVSINVQIVSTRRIDVEMTDRVEVGKCITATVQLYDESGMPLTIPATDFPHIRPELNSKVIEVVAAERDVKNPWPPGVVRFIITGIESGDAKVVFVGGKGDREVKSSPKNVHVFPPLKIIPKNITVIVGTIFQFSTRGGPRPDVNVEFFAVDGDIIDINKNGQFEALKVGKTHVIGRAMTIDHITGDRVICSEDNAEVRVVPMVGVEIVAPTTRFKVGTTVPAYAFGIPNRITPSVLGAVGTKIKFNWFFTGDDIVTLGGVFEHSSIFYNSENQISIRIHGRKPGRTTLHLNATVSDIITGRLETKRLSTVTFSAALELVIFKKLELIHPVDIETPHILLAPNTNLKLKTNVDGISQLTYSIQNIEMSEKSGNEDRSISVLNLFATVSESGLLQSYSNFGKAIICIKAVDEFGVEQTTSIVVEVKPVHYILTTPITVFKTSLSQPMTVIPRGVSFDLTVTYHDDTGVKFSAVHANPKIKSTRTDLALIGRKPPHLRHEQPDNTTVTIRMIKTGDAILEVHDDSVTEIIDYLKLHVDSVIKPDIKYLTRGDIVCYGVPLLSSFSHQGTWNTTDEESLKIDSEAGIVRAIKETDRSVRVAYTMDSNVVTSNDIRILPIERIKFLHMSKNLSNIMKHAEQEIPIVLMNRYDEPHKLGNLLTLHTPPQCNFKSDYEINNFPFSCQLEFVSLKSGIDITHLFSVSPHFNLQTGQYSCKITTMSDPTVQFCILESNVSLIVHSGSVDTQISLSFIPAVHVNVEELYFNDDKYRAHVIVHGLSHVLDQITIEPADKDLLEIGYPFDIGSTSKRFDIKLLDFHWKVQDIKDAMSIILKSELTKQYLKIPVKVDITEKLSGRCVTPRLGSPVLETFWNFRHMLAVIISVIVIFVVTLYAYSHYIQPVINVNVDSHRSLLMERPRVGNSTPISPFIYNSPRSNLLHQYGSGIISPVDNTSNCSNSFTNNSGQLSDTEPVYGDPNSFSRSPIRRNKRFL